MPMALRIPAMTAGIFLLAVFCAISLFLTAATDGESYYEIQVSLGVDAGIDNGTMQELDMLLARYLSGDADALSETGLFNADEKAHMEDVYAIFAALRVIKNAAFAVSVLLLVLVYYKRADFSRMQLRLGIILGVILFFLPFAAIACWAALDFESAFIWMHETLFSNELWLMDPDTDLMIRMLPDTFFIALGGRAALRAALGALALPLVIFVGTIDWGKLSKKKS